MRLALLLAALAATLALGLAELMTRGEVVTLITEDRYGVHRDTPLWVVERGEVLYLRAARPDAAWVRRGRIHPLVEVRRNGIRSPYVFVPIYDDRIRAFVNEAMARKYGLADRVFTLLADPARTLPIRLEPRERRAPLEAPPPPEIRSPLTGERVPETAGRGEGSPDAVGSRPRDSAAEPGSGRKDAAPSLGVGDPGEGAGPPPSPGAPETAGPDADEAANRLRLPGGPAPHPPRR